MIILCTATLNAQVQKSGNISTHTDSIITNMPEGVGTDEYQHPGTSDLNTWGEAVDSMLTSNYSGANTIASSFDYRVVEFTDTSVSPSKDYYILENNPSGTNYWGTFVLNPSPDRSKLVIESPHPLKDYNTGKQGFYIFMQTGAKAFYVSGASRCNSSDTTLCDGKSSVCTGSSEAYKISDQAHASDGVLQKTTERLLTANSNSIFIQPHGFEKGDSDPDVIMSNGVQDDTPPTDYLSTLKTNLFSEDNSLTFKIGHIDTTWDRLLGTTNTQGRYINGSADPCDISATTNTGQFLHLEQAKVKLRETESDWDKMANAISATFSSDVLPVELVSFIAAMKDDNIILKWQTATEINNYGFHVERYLLPSEENDFAGSGWETLGFVAGHGNSNSPKNYEYVDVNPPSGDYKYRLKQIDTDGSFEYLSVIVQMNIDMTGLEGNYAADDVPQDYKLFQNYPNPFNPNTNIRFSIPETKLVNLKVYNIAGEEVKTFLEETISPGYHDVILDASSLSSGLYFYKLTAGNYSSVKKMLLLK